MDHRSSLCAGALLCGTGVALGAFAAHGLKSRLEPEQLAAFETAVRYQLLHGLGLLVLAALARHGCRIGWAARCILAGTVLFSGSIYLLVLTTARWPGPITPIGGVLLLLGWTVLLAQNLHARPARA